MIAYLVLLLYGAAVVGLVALLRRLRPAWSRQRMTWTAILPAPLAAVVAMATGIVTAFLMVAGVVLVAVLLIMGGVAIWIALRRTTPAAPPGRAEPIGRAFDTLLAPLPEPVQADLRQRMARRSPPATAADLFRAIHNGLVAAAIAERRGGYPGGRGKPGWTDYVAQQRRSVAAFRAVADAWGDPPADLATAVDRYDRSFPPPVRLQGDGWEPHVEHVAGRLVYGFPVASGHATFSFAFPVTQRDVDVLLADPYRRAVLEVVTHAVFQRSAIRDNPEVPQAGFDAIVAMVLHAPDAALAAYLTAFDRDHRLRSDVLIEQAMRRHAAAAAAAATAAEPR